MMGKLDPQMPLFVPGFDLGSRVRLDHPLRKVKETVDFSFVRPEVAHCYGYNGNESVDPEVILKMMFLLFFEDIKSERLLMRMIPERLDYLWFLGYTLEDKIPDHSVLSKARARWGPAAFESFFVRTVMQCVAFGLVDGSKIHVDASLVDANASNDSVLRGPREVVDAFRRVYISEEAKLEDFAKQGQEAAEEPEAPSWPPSPPEDRDAEESRYDPVNKGLVSTTDPDAAVVRHGKQEPRLRHKNHRAVDNAFGVVTATTSTPGDVTDNAELMGLVAQHEGNTRSTVETVVADSKYGTVENFRACKERGIRTHMADLAATQKGTGRRKGIFAEDAFVYDAQADTFTCPAGQTLRRRRHRKTRRAYEYTAGPKVCGACELREQCTRSKAGRTVKRHEGQELIDAARAEARSRSAKRDRLRRKHLMEGSFADAANNHHFKRSRWRGRWRQQIQEWLIAAAQNIRILLRHGPTRACGVLRGLSGLVAFLLRGLLRPAGGCWRALWPVEA